MPTAGISIGTASVSAVVAERSAVTREPFVVEPRLAWRPGSRPTLRTDDASGSVLLTGFVDRVADAVPLIATDGSAHAAADLVAAAVRSAASALGCDTAVVSYPSEWSEESAKAVTAAIARAGVSRPRLVRETTAVLARAKTLRSFPDDGIVLIFDLGGGLTVSLADAEMVRTGAFAIMRSNEWGGAELDYQLTQHALRSIGFKPDDADLESPHLVRELAVIRHQCREAKHRLSSNTSTTIDAQIGAIRETVRFTREDLDGLIREPMERAFQVVSELISANQVDPSTISAIVATGGGSSIPLVTELLSAGFGVPVIRDATPALTPAYGALLV